MSTYIVQSLILNKNLEKIYARIPKIPICMPKIILFAQHKMDSSIPQNDLKIIKNSNFLDILHI